MKEQLYMNKDTGEVLTYNEMFQQWIEEYDGGDPTNCMSIWEQYEKLPTEKTQIGIGHLIRAMQHYPFGHEEIMAMREALLIKDFSGIEFCDDYISLSWEDRKNYS